MPRMFVDNSPTLSFASSNHTKQEQFSIALPEHIPTELIQPQFDEDAIHTELLERGLTTESGVQYVVEISRQKLLQQRELLRQSDPPETDRIVIVSDSVILVQMPNGEMHAINRGSLSDEKQKEYERHINSNKYVRVVGAVSFGRKWGDSVFTTLSYVDVPLDSQMNLPLNVLDIPSISNGQYETGEVDVEYPDHAQMEYNYVFRPTARTTDFTIAAHSISGLTSEAMSLAEKTGRLDSIVVPLIKDVIHRFPFNSMGYYTEWIKSGLAKEDFYQMIGEQRRKYAAQHSGNCSHITLALLDALDGIGVKAKAAITAITRPPIDDAHDSTVVEFEGQPFLIDASLTIPYPIPYGSAPILPFSVHKGKDVYVPSRNVNGVMLPDLHLMRTKTRELDILRASRIVSSAELEAFVPQILLNVHDQVVVLKFDLFDQESRKVFESTFDRSTGEVFIRYTQDSNKKPLRVHYTELDKVAELPDVLQDIRKYAPQIMI